jgi:hypothetical protein
LKGKLKYQANNSKNFIKDVSAPTKMDP